MNGWRYGIVRGLSMWPALLPGDLVRGMEVDGNSLEPGDVVVLDDPGGAFIHRFVRFAVPRGTGCVMITAGDRSGRDVPRRVPGRVIRGTAVLRYGRWRGIGGRSPASSAVPGRIVGLHIGVCRMLSKFV